MTSYLGTWEPPALMAPRLSRVRKASTTSITAVVLMAPARQKRGSWIFTWYPSQIVLIQYHRRHEEELTYISADQGLFKCSSRFGQCQKQKAARRRPWNRSKRRLARTCPARQHGSRPR